MALVVVYDACVLYPAPLRDLLLRIGVAGLVRARWTERIFDECFRNLLANRPELHPAALERTRALMNRAVAECHVSGFEGLIRSISLPDPGDRHVLAAAIRAGAQLIVTFNLVDFPLERLAPFEVEAIHPDDFVHALIDLAPDAVCAVVAEQAAALRNPPRTLYDVLDTLHASGLARSVATLRELFVRSTLR